MYCGCCNKFIRTDKLWLRYGYLDNEIRNFHSSISNHSYNHRLITNEDAPPCLESYYIMYKPNSGLKVKRKLQRKMYYFWMIRPCKMKSELKIMCKLLDLYIEQMIPKIKSVNYSFNYVSSRETSFSESE